MQCSERISEYLQQSLSIGSRLHHQAPDYYNKNLWPQLVDLSPSPATTTETNNYLEVLTTIICKENGESECWICGFTRHPGLSVGHMALK